MTIQNAQLFMEGFWDWSILDGCFGTTEIKPTDIDGFVERYGNFLVLETKKQGVEIKTGQMITFNELTKTGKFTVIVIWGDKDAPTEMQVFYPHPQQPSAKKQATIDNLRAVVGWWFCNARR